MEKLLFTYKMSINFRAAHSLGLSSLSLSLALSDSFFRLFTVHCTRRIKCIAMHGVTQKWAPWIIKFFNFPFEKQNWEMIQFNNITTIMRCGLSNLSIQHVCYIRICFANDTKSSCTNQQIQASSILNIPLYIKHIGRFFYFILPPTRASNLVESFMFKRSLLHFETKEECLSKLLRLAVTTVTLFLCIL